MDLAPAYRDSTPAIRRDHATITAEFLEYLPGPARQRPRSRSPPQTVAVRFHIATIYIDEGTPWPQPFQGDHPLSVTAPDDHNTGESASAIGPTDGVGVSDLEAIQARLAAIVASSEDAIASKTLEGIVTSWNAAAERLFGFTAQEMVGRSILTIIPEELHHEEAEILAKLRAGQRIERQETVRVHKSGRRLEISLTVSPIRDSHGRVVGAAKIAHDI